MNEFSNSYGMNCNRPNCQKNIIIFRCFRWNPCRESSNKNYDCNSFGNSQGYGYGSNYSGQGYDRCQYGNEQNNFGYGSGYFGGQNCQNSYPTDNLCGDRW